MVRGDAQSNPLLHESKVFDLKHSTTVAVPVASIFGITELQRCKLCTRAVFPGANAAPFLVVEKLFHETFQPH
jgi:hypothetical protein